MCECECKEEEQWNENEQRENEQNEQNEQNERREIALARCECAMECVSEISYAVEDVVFAFWRLATVMWSSCCKFPSTFGFLCGLLLLVCFLSGT